MRSSVGDISRVLPLSAQQHEGWRMCRAGVVFKPITDQLLRIETALLVRRDQMHGTMQEFVEVALSKFLPLKLLPL